MADLIGFISPILNVVLGGGTVGFYLKYRHEARKLTFDEQEALANRKRSDFDRALEVVTSQRNDALKVAQECQRRMDGLEMEIQGLRFARDLDPFPNWIIGLDGKYLYANREFEKQFLEPDGKTYRSVIGETHETLWPEAFCRVLRNLDALARRVPEGHARATTTLVVAGVERQVTIHKFPIRIRDAVVGFAGFITDIQLREELIA